MVAEFATATALLAAEAALRDSGWNVVTTYSPFQLDPIDPKAPPRAASRLPLIGLLGGLAGGVGAWLIEWWTNARSYPINVGGRPRPGIPAFVPIVFESTILAAALCIVAGWFIILGLPRLWSPLDELEQFQQAAVDGYWVQVRVDEPDAERAAAALRDAGAARVVRIGTAA
ncbi:MAG: quinol:electron acceptor oxidoreductase subunit ActD [Gemmatimonadales bacterium]